MEMRRALFSSVRTMVPKSGRHCWLHTELELLRACVQIFQQLVLSLNTTSPYRYSDRLKFPKNVKDVAFKMCQKVHLVE